MSRFAKLGVQVPPAVRERFMELERGQKQLACTAGLLWYFALDEQTQFAYRIWAQSVADGQGTMEEPPRIVRAALEERGRESGAAPQPKKRGRQ
jgi:hypothetical protein